MARKKCTGISLDKEVIDYLDTLAVEEDRTRSQMIARIVKEHAERKGKPIDLNKNNIKVKHATNY